MQNIHFIINPISGSGNYSIDKELIVANFPKEEFNVTFKYTAYKNHAIALTQDSIDQKATIIVACGGDGTINEVAGCLVNTSIVLGIIARGSGNGLASNLKISKNIEKAIAVIKNQHILRIDVGKVNENYFFSNMGIGFDAEVISQYEKMPTRGLISYVKSSIKAFKSYKFSMYEYSLANEEFSIQPFLFFISNSNEMGNNITITPKASLQDGLLDVIIVPKINKIRMLFFGLLLLIRKHYLLKEVTYKQLDSLVIKRNNTSNFNLQIDGELYVMNNDTLKISILKKSLAVIIP
tara:strand:- start:46013 stop:46894 length:882 start_codon:yes stop_codon:yes gene_type:complete